MAADTVMGAELDLVKQQLQTDIFDLKEQISIFQARLAALEAQVAHIEPMVEARSSRTEKLVLMLQLELQRFHKAFDVHETKEGTHQEKVEKALDVLLERSGAGL
jgi:hypothetical protein